MGSHKFMRKQKDHDQNPRLLIVSEGAVTELELIEAVKRPRIVRSAEIEYVPPGPTSPVEIVQRALALRERDKKVIPSTQSGACLTPKLRLPCLGTKSLVVDKCGLTRPHMW
jgi:hypothetical protein